MVARKTKQTNESMNDFISVHASREHVFYSESLIL